MPELADQLIGLNDITFSSPAVVKYPKEKLNECPGSSRPVMSIVT